MRSSCNCLIIAGEKSGEEHCLSFFDDIQKTLPSLTFWGVGGDQLKSKGMELLYHLNEFSSWGLSEVIHKIPFYLKALNRIEAEVVKRETKIAILIDFQDFNLRLAKRLKKRGVAVLYYVAPQAWAWKAWRGKVLGDVVHTLFTIIPFEKKWFMERGANQVVGVSHPVLEKYRLEIEKALPRNHRDIVQDCHLLLLPGSRNSEVKYHLSAFVKIALKLRDRFPIKIGIVCSSSVNHDFFKAYEDSFDIIFSDENLAEGLKWGDLSIAASGTVTLACALFQLPTVVCYKTSLLNDFIINEVIGFSSFGSLANIVHEKEIFPEFLTDKFDEYQIYQKILSWITFKDHYDAVLCELKKTQTLLEGEKDNVGVFMGELIKDSYAF